MFRAIREIRGVVADYTVGTVIVFVHLTLKRRRESNRLLP
jgi:hypothetical protein